MARKQFEAVRKKQFVVISLVNSFLIRNSTASIGRLFFAAGQVMSLIEPMFEPIYRRNDQNTRKRRNFPTAVDGQTDKVEDGTTCDRQANPTTMMFSHLRW